MKKIFIYISILLVISSMVACIKDKSHRANKCIAALSFDSELEDEYTINRGDMLEIIAPSITQKPLNKELSYSWELEGKEISKEKDLRYTFNDFGTFKARLKVSNDDDIIFKEFKVNVLYSIAEGLIVLGQKDIPVISYIPINSPSKKIQIDIIEEAGNHFPAGSQADYLYVNSYIPQAELYISTRNPYAIYRLNSNLMLVQSKIDEEITSPISFIKNDGGIGFSDHAHAIVGHKIKDIPYKYAIFSPYDSHQKFVKIMGEDYSLADCIDYTYSGGTRNLEIYFDNNSSKMYFLRVSEMRPGSNTPDLVEVFPNSFTNKELLYLRQTGEGSTTFAALFIDKTTKKYYSAYFNAGFFSEYLRDGKSKLIPESLDYFGEINSPDLNENIVMTVAPSKNLMYYSSNNKIYIYSILSKGNYPSVPSITCGENGLIVDMCINPNGQELYVAVNESDNMAKLYRYNTSDNSLISVTDIGHKIVKIGYKKQ